MSGGVLGDRSVRNLQGVHPDLVAIVRRAAVMVAERDDGLGFVVSEGVRSITRQAELVKARASRTMNSRHLTGHAVDLAATVGDQVRWDWPLYEHLAAVMKASAQGIPLVWGGDWQSLKDGPHFELDRLAYPA
jgi:peptidoglycan L-alanyl-D-glutamate endopeptidase CwlK